MPMTPLLTAALASGDIAGTLAKLNPTHPDYARLKAELARTPASATAKRKLIRANMDRWRWLARDLGTQYLITNVPEFQLRLTVKDRIISTYRTIVGKPGRTATPQLAEMVEGVVFNPTWTVPPTIFSKDVLPAIKVDPGYLSNKNMQVLSMDGAVIDPTTIDWQLYPRQGFPYMIRQQAGPDNALGRLKIMFPNEYMVYLHDTPSRELFKRN